MCFTRVIMAIWRLQFALMRVSFLLLLDLFPQSMCHVRVLQLKYPVSEYISELFLCLQLLDFRWVN